MIRKGTALVLCAGCSAAENSSSAEATPSPTAASTATAEPTYEEPSYEEPAAPENPDNGGQEGCVNGALFN